MLNIYIHILVLSSYQLSVSFQHAGAYNDKYFNCHISNCLIGHFGPEAWPVRSPHLTPLDYSVGDT